MTHQEEVINNKGMNEYCDSKTITKQINCISGNSPMKDTNEHNERMNKQRNDNDNQEETIPSLSKRFLKENLEKVFMSYAKYNTKENDYFITQLVVNKLLKDSNIIIECGIKLSEIDLLYKKICPLNTKMNLERFMTFLVRLPRRLYPKEFEDNPKAIVDFFMMEFLDKMNMIMSRNNTITIKDEMQYTPNALVRYTPDEKQRYVIFIVFDTIVELYSRLFDYSKDYANKHNLTRQSCLKNIITFLKSFDVFPYILNETYLVTYFNMLIDINEKEYNHDSIHHCRVIDSRLNIGTCFTLDNFCLLLIHLSLLSFRKSASYDDNQCDVSKLLIFLEGLEHSNGMKEFKQKYNINIKHTLIPKKTNYTELGYCMENEIKGLCSDRYTRKISVASSDVSIRKSYEFDESKDVAISTRTELSPGDVIDLTRTFLHFCHIGNKSSYDLMNLSDFIHFLEHCKLYHKKNKKCTSDITSPKKEEEEISRKTLTRSKDHLSLEKINGDSNTKGRNKENADRCSSLPKPTTQASTSRKYSPYLKESDIGLIFSFITRPKGINEIKYKYDPKKIIKNQRITFDQFIESFSLIAQRLFPKDNPDEALRRIILNNIIPNLIKEEQQNANDFNKKIQEAFETITLPDIQLFLEDLSEILYSFFVLYSDSDHYMTFMSMLQFYKDFDLFPKMINLTHMKDMIFVFTQRKHSYKETNIDTIIIKENISFSNFIESIAITALLFYNQNHCYPIYKLLSIVEVLAQSKGYDKIKLKSGRQYIKENTLIEFLLKIKKEQPQLFYNEKKLACYDCPDERKRSMRFDDIYLDDGEVDIDDMGSNNNDGYVDEPKDFSNYKNYGKNNTVNNDIKTNEIKNDEIKNNEIKKEDNHKGNEKSSSGKKERK